MTLGLILYVLGRRNLEPAIERIAAAKAAKPVVTDAAPVSLGFTAQEWKRIAVIFMFFVFAAIFWAAYEQAASTLSLFADRYADRNVLGFEIPVSWYLDDFPPLAYVTGIQAGMQDTETIYRRWKDIFDYGYERVDNPVFVSCVHPQIIGQARHMLWYERLIEYIALGVGTSLRAWTPGEL